jgi:xylulokinase
VLLVAGLDVGGSSVKAWVQQVGGRLVASATVPTSTHREGFRAELDPVTWEAAARKALAEAVDGVQGEWLGLTVSSLRQGFLLLDAEGTPLGRGVLNSDRRGGPYAAVLEEPERWAQTRRVLFVHDWLVDLLTGTQVTEASYACAGAMADVARRTWAQDLLDSCGVGADLLAPVVEAGTVVGGLRPGWGLPPGLPVVAGCGDTQLAAMGAGGLAPGVVTVVAGSSTPVIATTAAPVRDPLCRPWVSTHAATGLWAVEGNAGYPGTFSGWWSGLAPGQPTDDPAGVTAVTAVELWSQPTWEHKPPWSLLGVSPLTTGGQVQRALLEAHAFAVAGAVDDLSRLLGPAREVVVTGGAAQDNGLPALLAQVLGRDVRWDREPSAAAAGTALVARALDAGDHVPGVPETVCPAGDPAALADRRRTWTHATSALRTAFDPRSTE